MPGTATVTINENQWNVEVASTIDELTTGLSGRASIPAGTGMLFILPATQQVTVDTSQMLFPIDIIFIKDSVVIDVAMGIEPGYEVTEETPCDMFLEVNAGEASLVEAGDAVSVEMAPTGGFDWSSIMSFAIPLALLGFVSGMVSGMVGSSSHSSLGHPSSEEEATFPPEARKDLTFCKHMWDLEKTMGRSLTREEVAEKWEAWKKLRYRPKTEEERKLSHELKYGTEELPERGSGQREQVTEYRGYKIKEYVHPDGTTDWWVTNPEGKFVRVCFSAREAREVVDEELAEHHSMWLTLDQRKELEKKYGMVAVRWAEEATKPGDIKAAERAAEYYYGKVKEALGLGHLSPELSEQQIMKLRELLGLPADMAEVLKIHRETGYIP